MIKTIAVLLIFFGCLGLSIYFKANDLVVIYSICVFFSVLYLCFQIKFKK